MAIVFLCVNDIHRMSCCMHLACKLITNDVQWVIHYRKCCTFAANKAFASYISCTNFIKMAGHCSNAETSIYMTMWKHIELYPPFLYSCFIHIHKTQLVCRNPVESWGLSYVSFICALHVSLSLFVLAILEMKDLDVHTYTQMYRLCKDVLQHLQLASVFLSYTIDCLGQLEAGQRCMELALSVHLSGFSCKLLQCFSHLATRQQCACFWWTT